MEQSSKKIVYVLYTDECVQQHLMRGFLIAADLCGFWHAIATYMEQYYFVKKCRVFTFWKFNITVSVYTC